MKEVFFMPDNLRITTPVGNTEGINKPNPAGELQHLNPINPNRVPKTNNEETGGQAEDLLLNRNSVYSQFIEQLLQTPNLTQTLQKLLSGMVAQQGLASLQMQADSPLRQLLSSLATEKDGVLENLAFQQNDSTQFTGPLFKLLGQLSQQYSDSQLDLRIADFLKAFSGYFTAEETTQAILGNLDDIKYSIPLPFAKKLLPFIDKLSTGNEPGSSGHNADRVNSNLSVIKKEIIPMLGEYVSKTNDYGKSRNTISMLMQNTAILNESTKENLAEKFNQLIRYCKYNLKLPDVTVGLLQQMFAKEVYSHQQGKQNGFMNALTSLLSHAADKSSPNGVDKAVLQDICKSLVLDNSVHMPFQHIFLPAEINGRFLFTQLWIEKNDPDDEHKTAAVSSQNAKSVYLTFDIQDLGYFEASVRILGKQVTMKLACPPTLNRLHGEIRTGITHILENNGLSAENIKLSACTSPQVPQIIMDKIQERKHAVNVSV